MSKGIGTRFDKFTPNETDRERAKPTRTGYFIGDYRVLFCVKCQKEKPRAGSVVRSGLRICKGCS